MSYICFFTSSTSGQEPPAALCCTAPNQEETSANICRTWLLADGNPLCVVLQDLLKFYSFAFLLQLCIFMLYVGKANKHPASARSIVTRVVNVFIAAAPPGAPTVIVAALTCCIVHLNRSQGLVILVPEKVKTIANVEVVCFDKTGTLTGSLVSPCLAILPLLCHSTPLLCPLLSPLCLSCSFVAPLLQCVLPSEQ